MQGIDLNCDMGESFGSFVMGMDSEVMPHITSANIACGMHAGDPTGIVRTVRSAAEHGVGLGAHPGLPDLVGFGRRKMDVTAEEVYHDVLYQVAALKGIAEAHGAGLQHVKPHGALYHMVLEDESIARGVAQAVAKLDPELICVTLAGPKGDLMAEACRQTGLRVAREGFPDRAYNADGTLVSRRLPGAVVEDPGEVAQRALHMAKSNQALTADGTRVDLQAQTLCVHGDTPSAVELVKSIRATLEKEGLALQSLGGLLA
jgi:UPF0271 protein